MTRAHLEALVVAIAIVRPEYAPTLAREVNRDRVSPSCWALLQQLADPTPDLVETRTAAQAALAARVEAITIADLVEFRPATVLALVNQLPERALRPAAWERDLATRLTDGSAAA